MSNYEQNFVKDDLAIMITVSKEDASVSILFNY